MKLKRVSFEVAKALKEAGYPQGVTEYVYNNDGSFSSRYDYDSWGIDTSTLVDMPYAMEVWLWLWREKKISIEISERFNNIDANMWDNKDYKNPIYLFDIDDRHNYPDPEEAIIAAIEYLVTNNLIK